MSKFCPDCGEELVDSAKFCKSCGKKLEFNQNAVENQYQTTPPAVEKTHTLATILGFVCAFIFPLLGIVFGIYLVTRKDASKYKIYGILIIVIAVIVWLLSMFIMRMWI